MQTTANPQKQPSNRTRNLLLAGIGFIAFCCVIVGVLVFASPSASPSMTLTPAVEPQGTVVNDPPATTGPAPTVVPPTTELGITRDQPLPMDAKIDIGGGMQVTILSVTRPADDIVLQGNMFNDTPVPNAQEYLMVNLQVECTKSSNDKCSFNAHEFKTVGADGQVHDPASVAGIPQEFETFAEFFGGAVLTGNVVFLVTQGDDQVVLFHDPLFFGDPIYISIQ